MLFVVLNFLEITNKLAQADPVIDKAKKWVTVFLLNAIGYTQESGVTVCIKSLLMNFTRQVELHLSRNVDPGRTCTIVIKLAAQVTTPFG